MNETTVKPGECLRVPIRSHVDPCKGGCGRMVMNRIGLCNECAYRFCKCGARFRPFKERALCKACWKNRQRLADRYA